MNVRYLSYLNEKNYFYEIKFKNLLQTINMFNRHENDSQTKEIIKILKEDIDGLKKSVEEMEKYL